MISPGLEPGTACVLDRSDNQLHHETILGLSIQNYMLYTLASWHSVDWPTSWWRSVASSSRRYCTLVLIPKVS